MHQTLAQNPVEDAPHLNQLEIKPVTKDDLGNTYITVTQVNFNSAWQQSVQKKSISFNLHANNWSKKTERPMLEATHNTDPYER